VHDLWNDFLSCDARIAQFPGLCHVRVALGSGRAALMRLVLMEASYPIFTGLAIGCFAAVGAARGIRSLLYQNSSTRTLVNFAQHWTAAGGWIFGSALAGLPGV
jgi:hypothetical protein